MTQNANDARLRVLFVSAEMVPFAKEGGLSDVAGALPKALAELGCDIRTIIPLYGSVARDKYEIEPVAGLPDIAIPMGERTETAKLYQAKIPDSEVKAYLVENKKYFDRDGVYNDPATGEGYPDTAERFILFQKAVMGFLRELEWQPRIVHGNDFHTGFIPYYLKRDNEGGAEAIASLFSIHNLAYQGVEEPEILPIADIPADQFYPVSAFEYYGKVNMMKVGIVFADMINTVSPTYAREIQSGPKFGFGLEGVLRSRASDVRGIVNGIDYSIWNPETDELIPARYSAADLSGKTKNKRELLKRSKLPVSKGNVPLIGIISRLVEQKGFDILGEALENILEMDVQMVVLGTGKREYHDMFEKAAKQYSKQLAVELAFDNQLAHLIEAGSDMFLMPSSYEPCGLNQLYSLRYGTIPIVRATGGLADTIQEYNPATGQGTGFRFEEYSADALTAVVQRALKFFGDREAWSRLVQNAMAADFSWKTSAEQYIDLYHQAINNAS